MITKYDLIRIEMKMKQVFRVRTMVQDISKTVHSYPFEQPVRFVLGNFSFVVDRTDIEELEDYDEQDSVWRDAFMLWMKPFTQD